MQTDFKENAHVLIQKHQALPTAAGAARPADQGAGSGAGRAAGAAGAAGAAASRKKKDYVLRQGVDIPISSSHVPFN